jgi:hypothetical protein
LAKLSKPAFWAPASVRNFVFDGPINGGAVSAGLTSSNDLLNHGHGAHDTGDGITPLL